MRVEKDSIGVLEIDEDVYYGIQTVRVSELLNFRIDDRIIPPT
ncbi:hypothetical protein [Peribacillus frigoritolerans]